MNTTDRRVKRTKKLLADALAALMKQKPLKSITVRELTELADLNRGTFYLHFKDVYDLAEQIENEIFDRFNEIIADFDSSKNETLEVMESSQTLRFFLTRLFELLADNADMAQSLIGVNGDPAFIKKLKRRPCVSVQLYRIRVYRNMRNVAEFGDVRNAGGNGGNNREIYSRRTRGI
ncbi:MAG: TetR/AcrR family transcriptional regulator [Clostridiales bacterium]|nr:TetR/AcrR family transcriptional regulator [Clostridiales bacterium]